MRGWLPLITKMTWPPRASTRLFRSARECSASTVRHTPARSISSITGPMTVVSFVFRSTPRWAAFSRVRCQKNPRCWGASWAATAAVAAFRARSRALPALPSPPWRGPPGPAWRPCGPSSPLPAPSPWPCGPRRGAVPAAAPGEKISHAAASPAVHPHSRSSARSWSTPAGPATRRTVFSDGATWTPARLLSGRPSALSTRCGRLAAHSPTAVNESHPASRAAIATAITHANSEPHAPPVPRIRQPRQPVPQRCGRAGIR